MKPTWMNFIETATIGVVGRGSHGIASRCVECPSGRQGWDPCSGFGEGCLTKVAPETASAPEGRPPQP